MLSLRGVGLSVYVRDAMEISTEITKVRNNFEKQVRGQFLTFTACKIVLATPSVRRNWPLEFGNSGTTCSGSGTFLKSMDPTQNSRTVLEATVSTHLLPHSCLKQAVNR